MTNRQYDVAIIGAGIVGLAHALAATRLGKSVVVFDREAQANGASVRNFGFVTVTGQERGQCWSRAMRSRDVWAEIAPQAGIAIAHRGLLVAARRPEAADVLDAFLDTEMGDGCTLLTPEEAGERMPALRPDRLEAALWSPHELRVESRDAIPQLARWLERERGVTIHRQCHVRGINAPQVETSLGIVRAEAIIVCPGDEYLSLLPDRIAAYGLTKCKLQMMRVAPSIPTDLRSAVMSDLGLVRYLGYAALEPAAALRQRLEAEQASALEHGVHLIVVQSADGSLVVGDSHHYGSTPDPFGLSAVDDIILDEFDQILALPGRQVVERWTGIYASSPDRLALIDRPADRVRLVIVTSGTGASTSFAIGEEVIGELFG